MMRLVIVSMLVSCAPAICYDGAPCHETSNLARPAVATLDCTRDRGCDQIATGGTVGVEAWYEGTKLDCPHAGIEAHGRRFYVTLPQAGHYACTAISPTGESVELSVTAVEPVAARVQCSNFHDDHVEISAGVVSKDDIALFAAPEVEVSGAPCTSGRETWTCPVPAGAPSLDVTVRLGAFARTLTTCQGLDQLRASRK
jgi:hypothetical protein